MRALFTYGRNELLVVTVPYELPAVAAEGGLAQEGGHELVPVDLVHAPPHGAAPPREPRALLELAPARRPRTAPCACARARARHTHCTPPQQTL